jgi:hypothetical protein
MATPTPISLPKGYQRLGDFPLDASSVFESFAALQTYAATNGTAYPGQIVAVRDTGLVYIIRTDLSLSQVGATPDAGSVTGLDDLLAAKADLVDGKIPSSQLPSYVDDVLEFADLASFPAEGESGKIYVTIDTLKTYRWSGSVYAEISSSEVTSVAGKTGAVSLEVVDIDGLEDALDGKALVPIFSDTAPADPAETQRWVQTTSMRSYEYYQGAWVEIGSNDAIAYA